MMNNRGGTGVLIVDDDPDIADTYASQLGDQYDVTTTYSGRAGVAALDPAIDVVLLDRRMPDMSGNEVLETIRERGLEARVAMVTAEEPDFDIIEMPFDDYVQKPVSEADLAETVAHLKRFVDYEEGVREYYALTAKRAALLGSKSEAECEASDRFQELEREIETKRRCLSDVVAEFDATDFDRAFRDIARTESPPSAD
jgi:DNA-binding response OmpR family regulator